jgi:hypothetical protein
MEPAEHVQSVFTHTTPRGYFPKPQERKVRRYAPSTFSHHAHAAPPPEKRPENS